MNHVAGRFHAAAAAAAAAAQNVVPAVGEALMSSYATNSQSASTPVNNTLYFAPLIVPTGMTFNQIGVYINNAVASSVYRFGLYTSNATTYFPSTLVTDYGTVDTSTIAAKTLAIAMTLTANTLYYIGWAPQGGATAATIRTVDSTFPQWAPTVGNNGQWSGSNVIAYGPNTVTGALPAGPLSGLTAIAGGGQHQNLLYFLNRSA